MPPIEWWNDVLENGPSSPYADFFDVDWNPPKHDLTNKVLLPVLGEQYGKVLENKEIQIALRQRQRHISARATSSIRFRSRRAACSGFSSRRCAR